jgi:hypothetical protein
VGGGGGEALADMRSWRLRVGGGSVKCMRGGHEAERDQGRGWGGGGREGTAAEVMEGVDGRMQQRTMVVAPCVTERRGLVR